MSPFLHTHQNIPLFGLYQDLRQKGFNLGTEELIAAQKALQYGLGGENQHTLKSLLKMLWLGSREEFDTFDSCFAAYIRRTTTASEPKSQEPFPPTFRDGISRGMDSETSLPADAAGEAAPEPSTPEEVAPHGVQEEASIPLQPGEPSETPDEIHLIRHHDPCPASELRREWQQLESEHPSFTQLDLNVPATIKSIARKGYFDQPVLRPRMHQDLNLLLFMDSGGSMLPMEEFCQRWRSIMRKSIRVRQTRVCYFRNLPSSGIFRDTALQDPIPLRKFWGGLGGGNTVALIISDLGAARKTWDSIRILDARDFSRALTRKGFEQLWLNPLRRSYWRDTSAEKIAEKVPLMLSMSQDDTKEAIQYLNQHTKRRMR